MRGIYDDLKSAAAGGADQHGLAPTDEHSYEGDEELENSDRGLLEKPWFLTLLVGLALLLVAFIVLPYLVDWRSPPPPGSAGLAMSPSVPLQPSRAATPPAPPTAEAMTSPNPPALPLPPTRPESASAPPARNIIAQAPDAARESPAAPEPRSQESRISRTAALRPSKGEFWVQVGAFKDSKAAARMAARLTAEHYPVVMRRGAPPARRHVVWVGTYPTRKRAEEVRAALEQRGIRGFIRKVS